MKKTRANEPLSCEMKTCDWKKRGTLTFATTLSIPMNNDRLGKYAKVG